MPRRPRPEPLSPRAAARLRTPRSGYVPTARELSGRPLHVADDAGAVALADGPGAFGGAGRDEHGVTVVENVPRSVDGPRPRPGPGTRSAAEWWDHDSAAEWSNRASAGEWPALASAGEWPDDGSRLSRWVLAPAAFVGARWEPGRMALVGLALVVVAAVAVFGLRVAWASDDGTVLAPGGGSRAGPTGISAGSAPVGAPVPTGAGVPSSPAPGTSRTAPASVSSAPAGTSPTSLGPTGASPVGAAVVVHVVGQVRRPGLQRVPPGSRVADALAAAGGATAKADLTRVNLARALVDGEQVVVPRPGDPDPPGPPPPGAGSTAGGATPSRTPSLVSLNAADLAALDTLPGVGPVLAQRILDWRGEHGRFTSVDELGEVSGIGEIVLERLRPLVTL